jgi:uncharacterized OB-fold protein
MIAPRLWREMPQRYRYEAAKCKKCGKIFFPPRLICSACGSKTFDNIVLSRNGKVLTYTIIRVPPSQFKDEAPYAMGVVELEGGGRLTAQIVDCDFDKIRIGMPIKLEFRRIQAEGEAGVIGYGYKCVPV